MRTFYIFLINKHFKILTLNNPYRLYKVLEKIYNSNNYNREDNLLLFNQLRKDINKELINNNTYDYFKNNTSYTKYKNIHYFNDYFNNEKSKLVITKTYILLKTNVDNSLFIKYLKENTNNLFACDFINKDYFWIKKI